MKTKLPAKTASDSSGLTISLRLQRKRLQELDSVAAKAGMTRSSLIQLAVDRLLKQGL